jgi:hypothetical protein
LICPVWPPEHAAIYTRRVISKAVDIYFLT